MTFHISMHKAQQYTGELINLKEIFLVRGDYAEGQTTAEQGVVLRSKNGNVQLRIEKLTQNFISTNLKEERGRVLDNSSYYKLTALDEADNTWVVEKVLFVGSILKFPGEANYTFEVCSDCVCVKNSVGEENNEQRNKGYTLNILINEEMNLPSCWKWSIESGLSVTHTFLNGHSILLSKVSTQEESPFLIQYYSEKEVDESVVIARTICESMRFILAQQVSWFCMERVAENETKIWIHPSSRRTNHYLGRAKPPIQLDRVYPDHEAQFSSTSTDIVVCCESQLWHLYEKYFTFALEDKSGLHTHYLSGWIGRIVEIEYQSLEAEMLTLSIGVESIAKKYSSTLNQKTTTPPAKETEELDCNIRDLKAWIKEKKEREGESSFSNRLNGFIGSLKSTRETAKDVLTKLVTNRLIDKSLLKAWTKLRNGSAHGSIVEPEKYASYIQECDKLNLLLFHLIFLIIEYEGPFSDYSQERWPTKVFQKNIRMHL